MGFGTKVKIFMTRARSGSFRRLFAYTGLAAKEAGRSPVPVFFDVVRWMGHGVGYQDYRVFGFARLTDAQRELAEDEQALLERQLLRVQMLLDAGTPPVVAVTWFQPDAKKQGGAYVTAKGKVRKIDEFGGALLLVGGEKIPISAVIGIQLYNDKEQIEEG